MRHVTGRRAWRSAAAPLIAACTVLCGLLIVSGLQIRGDQFVGIPNAASAVAASSTQILIDPRSSLWDSSSYVLGTDRNHVAVDWSFPNGPAKLARMRELTPTWGQQKYLYRMGHGPTDGRLDISYMTGYHFEHSWGSNSSYPFTPSASYPYDDLRDYLYEANAMGADQLHVVNFGTSDAAEAARYVSYLNNPSDANRPVHPYPEQDARMFELGNEISWATVRGHAQYAPDETTYATRAKTFAQAMRASSSVPIQIGAVASTNSNWTGDGWSGGATTVQNILTTMGSDVDFLIFHGYPSWPLYTNGSGDGQELQVMAQNEWNRQKLESEIRPAIARSANGHPVWLANTEEYAAYDDTFSRGMFGALYNADSIVTAVKEDIRIVIEFCFSHGRLRDSRFFYADDPAQTTPIFQWQKLLAQHWGDHVVATSDQQIPTTTVTTAYTTLQLPMLSYAASIKGDKEYVLVVNRVNDTDVVSQLSPGFTPTAVTAYEMWGPSGWDATTFTCNSTETTCQAGDLSVDTINNPDLSSYTFKRASITIFEISGLQGTPTPSSTVTLTQAPTSTPSPTLTLSPTGTPSATSTWTPSPTGTPRLMPSPSATPTATATSTYIAAATVTPTLIPTANAGDLLTNGDFELGLSQWLVPDWLTGVIQSTSSPTHSGTGALRFSGSTNGAVIYQEVPVSAGQLVTFAGWANVPSPGGDGRFLVELVARQSNNGTLRTFTIASGSPATSTWVEMTGSAVMPPGTVSVRVQVRYVQLKGTAYFDDFSLRAGP